MASQIQVAIRHSAIPPPAPVLSQSNVLSIVSSVIGLYPSVTSAYLFGPHAKGTARPDSDVDIALFLPNLTRSELIDIGGIHADLENALKRKVDLSVRPPHDFVEKIKTHWIPIDLRCGVLGLSRNFRSATPPPVPALSQSDVLSITSSVIRSYPSVTSAYLFGSRAKGTARPDSDVDIALFLPNLTRSELIDIGGIHADLENALKRKVDLLVRPPDDFVEKIKTYWIPINLPRGMATDGPIDTNR